MADQGWTARRRRTLERYVADLAPRMRLADWTITVLWEEASGASAKALPDDALATITPQPSSKHACIRVSPLLLTLTPTEQTQALVHELVHCHLFALVESAQTTFSLLGKRERKVAELALNQHVETTTDALADVIAPLVPTFVLGPGRTQRPGRPGAEGSKSGSGAKEPAGGD